jgi:hypothetical protein
MEKEVDEYGVYKSNGRDKSILICEKIILSVTIKQESVQKGVA